MPPQVLARFSRKILPKPEEVPKSKIPETSKPKTSETLVFAVVIVVALAVQPDIGEHIRGRTSGWFWAVQTKGSYVETCSNVKLSLVLEGSNRKWTPGIYSDGPCGGFAAFEPETISMNSYFKEVDPSLKMRSQGNLQLMWSSSNHAWNTSTPAVSLTSTETDASHP